MKELLETNARVLAHALEGTKSKVVLAESCTAGLVAASLGAVPGISEFFCGSFVTYRETLKISLLGISRDLLAEHTAVSEPVTVAMARQSLSLVEEAHWSAAVTGHLGPNAPEDQDGQVFVALARRVEKKGVELLHCREFRLRKTARVSRQQEAALEVLKALIQAIEN